MTRTTAREIAMHLIYEMEYHDELPEELFQKVFEEDYYPRLAEETDLYQEKPNAKQLAYIEDCVRGVYVKKQEIDQIIARISKVLALAVNRALQPHLSAEDIALLTD